MSLSMKYCLAGCSCKLMSSNVIGFVGLLFFFGCLNLEVLAVAAGSLWNHFQ